MKITFPKQYLQKFPRYGFQIRDKSDMDFEYNE